MGNIPSSLQNCNTLEQKNPLTWCWYFVILFSHTKSGSNSQMKTKALLLAGLFSLAGAMASEAQTVYSVNAVGYVNVTVPTGFSLISNPLLNGNNKVSTVLANVPNGTIIYKFNAGTGSYVANSFFLTWSNPDMVLAPGEGVFIRNTGASYTLTFTGEVAQGALSTALSSGFQIVSSQVPQSGQLDTVLGFPAANGDIVYRFNSATQTYQAYSYFLGWGGGAPVINVGESFFVKKASATSWSRSFTVSSN